jgi:hypothetical protein
MGKKPRMGTNKHGLGGITEHTENTEVGFGGLVSDIREIISQARSLTRRSVNALQVVSNYLIGKRIVLEEQGGSRTSGLWESNHKGAISRTN